VNWIDLILLTVLALFGLRGYFRGVFREIFSLLGLLAGFMAAVDYREPVAALAASYWGLSPFVLKGAAFVAIFFSAYVALSSVGLLLHRSQKLLFLQTFDRVGGIAVGIGKGTAVTALLVFFLGSSSWVPNATRDDLDGSYLTPPLSQFAEGIVRFGRDRLVPKGADGSRPLTASSPRGSSA
jgi:membrane protein required for colicin V production